jgi:hypothetical protein
MDGYLTFEHGNVKLGGTLLPGILTSLRVKGDVRFDSASPDGMSGKTKTPLGWEDAAIVLALDLLTESGSDCYEKVGQLNALFKGYDNDANPRVLTVVNRHMAARGVERVVFSGFETAETERDDVIVATLSFTEHNPVITRAESAANQRVVGQGNNTKDPGLAGGIGERSR